MKTRVICLFALLSFSLPALAIPQTNTDPQPLIIWGARIKGKKLFVAGGNFQDGAVIILNGEKQKTENDLDLPTYRLRAKKAAKRIASDEISTVQVQNPDGQLSEIIPVYGGINVSFESGPYWELELSKGQRFLLYLTNFTSPDFKWGYSITRQGIIRVVDEVQIPAVAPGALAQVFEAVEEGATAIYATGDIPCSGPPCPARPAMQLTVGISIK